MKALFIFGSFADDSQSVLAAIQRLTGVVCKCSLDGLLGVALKLRVAAFADADHRLCSFDHAELSFRHASSLPLGDL